MLNIRRAERNDVGIILKFIQALASYEHLSGEVVATEQDLLRDGFGAEPKFRCVIAEWDQTPVGFALYFYNYSTFQGRPGIYLEDLFVDPQFRGKGIGKALLLHLAQIAVARELRPLCLAGARLEHALDRVLPVAWGKDDARVAYHASGGRGAEEHGWASRKRRRRMTDMGAGPGRPDASPMVIVV